MIEYRIVDEKNHRYDILYINKFIWYEDLQEMINKIKSTLGNNYSIDDIVKQLPKEWNAWAAVDNFILI